MNRCCPESQGKRQLQIRPWPKCVGSRHSVRRNGSRPRRLAQRHPARAQRAVRVHHALGLPGRAGGEEDQRVLVERRRAARPAARPAGSASASRRVEHLDRRDRLSARATSVVGRRRTTARSAARRRAPASRSRTACSRVSIGMAHPPSSRWRAGRRRTRACCRSAGTRGRRRPARGVRRRRGGADTARRPRSGPSAFRVTARSAARGSGR